MKPETGEGAVATKGTRSGPVLGTHVDKVEVDCDETIDGVLEYSGCAFDDILKACRLRCLLVCQCLFGHGCNVELLLLASSNTQEALQHLTAVFKSVVTCRPLYLLGITLTEGT